MHGGPVCAVLSTRNCTATKPELRGVGLGKGLGGAAGYTQADADALVAFQQEMMQVALAASAGDASAKARLETWQALTLKHEGEIQKLTVAAQGGDMAAIQKLQLMQITLMKEWANSAGVKARLANGARP